MAKLASSAVASSTGPMVAVRSKDGLSEIETSRGQLLLVEGQPDAVAGFLNKVRRIGMVA
jgi:hypothetical protein